MFISESVSFLTCLTHLLSFFLTSSIWPKKKIKLQFIYLIVLFHKSRSYWPFRLLEIPFNLQFSLHNLTLHNQWSHIFSSWIFHSGHLVFLQILHFLRMCSVSDFSHGNTLPSMFCLKQYSLIYYTINKYAYVYT